MTKLVAGISKAAVEREAAMMEASSNFIWSRKLRALRAALDKAEADHARLREVVLEADKLLCGDLAGLQWKRECRSFLVLARAVLKGETRD